MNNFALATWFSKKTTNNILWLTLEIFHSFRFLQKAANDSQYVPTPGSSLRIFLRCESSPLWFVHISVHYPEEEETLKQRYSSCRAWIFVDSEGSLDKSVDAAHFHTAEELRNAPLLVYYEKWLWFWWKSGFPILQQIMFRLNVRNQRQRTTQSRNLPPKIVWWYCARLLRLWARYISQFRNDWRFVITLPLCAIGKLFGRKWVYNTLSQSFLNQKRTFYIRIIRDLFKGVFRE